MYPTQLQRESIGKNWDNFAKIVESHSVEGTMYDGSFHEGSGFGTDEILGTIYGEGQPVYPTSLDGDMSIPAPPLRRREASGIINLVYHFHPTAGRRSYDRFNTKGGIPEYLFDQSPSINDINNASSLHRLMINGGVLLQISKKEGVNFYNSNGITLNMPIKVFAKPMKIRIK